MADAGRDLFAGVFDEPTPEVGAVPERVRGFRVRVDLMYAKPPIWRRLVLPGDLVLDELHDVLQVAMGWQDSCAGANSYYFDKHGDVPLRPTTTVESIWRSRRFDLADYRFERRPAKKADTAPQKVVTAG
ncbi:IS1096 element passenger TnpR family protein [Mycobacteroides abscessus]|uniref:IS1096 element passenger TnpR family protein n=1 Tax=Mycobacteroides abscessus TaxID=36809 RepID=UPI0039BDFEE2